MIKSGKCIWMIIYTHLYKVLFPSICRHGLAYFPQQLHVEVNQQLRNCKIKGQATV